MTDGLYPMSNTQALRSHHPVRGPHARALAAVSQQPIRVRLIADTELVAAGVAALIGEHPGRAVVVGNACPPGDIDVVLLDGANAGTIVSDIVDLTASGHRLIVVFDWHLDPATMGRARAAGAAGFVSKALSAQDLFSALLCACREGDIQGRPLAPPLLSVVDHVWQPSGLSKREAHVIALISHGLSNGEIATDLFLSINTIKTYIRGAYRKIGVTSRSQAVAWAFGSGFITGQLQGPPRGGAHNRRPADKVIAGTANEKDT